MLSSFSTALSALTADETAINVVGNNLANLNTPGFKDTVVSFSDLISQSLNGQTQVGNGVGTPVTLANFSRGAITATAGPLDAAIQGKADSLLSRARITRPNTRAAAISRLTPPALWRHRPENRFKDGQRQRMARSIPIRLSVRLRFQLER